MTGTSRAVEPCRVRRRHAEPSDLLVRALPQHDWADAFSIQLPVGVSGDVDQWRCRLFDAPARRPNRLMNVRNFVARRIGLQQVSTTAAAGFRVVAGDRTEVIVGSDDRHLDFRVSLTLDVRQVRGLTSGPAPVLRELVVTTVVQRHNLLGHLYFAMVRPAHRLLVPLWTRRAVREACVADLRPHHRTAHQ